MGVFIDCLMLSNRVSPLLNNAEAKNVDANKKLTRQADDAIGEEIIKAILELS